MIQHVTLLIICSALLCPVVIQVLVSGRREGGYWIFLAGGLVFLAVFTVEILFVATLHSCFGENLHLLIWKTLLSALIPALFEEGGKLVILCRLCKKKHALKDVISFGLGYGFVEALIILMPQLIAVLLGSEQVNVVDVTVMVFERLYVGIMQISLAAIIFAGIEKGRAFYGFAGALLLHFVLDFGVVLRSIELVTTAVGLEAYGASWSFVTLVIAANAVTGLGKERTAL